MNPYSTLVADRAAHRCECCHASELVFNFPFSVDEIQHDPLKYLSQVGAGESFVIVQADKAIAELRPITSSPKKLRPFGLCAGEFTVPDDFDVPLPPTRC